jgi:adenylate cyclase
VNFVLFTTYIISPKQLNNSHYFPFSPKMSTEIEHKYLVTSRDFIDGVSESHTLQQGYLSRDKGRTVRVRIWDKSAFLTIKGANTGASRPEFEYPIPVDDALQLLQLCPPPIISKTRHIYKYEGNKWEIDEFHGELEGLILAEIEIPSEDYQFKIPAFVGKDVTNDPRYYNSHLHSLKDL